MQLLSSMTVQISCLTFLTAVGKVLLLYIGIYIGGCAYGCGK